MDKGIRVNVTAKFNELNTERLQGTLSNKAFRRDVMAYAIAEFDITVASAATHYNYCCNTGACRRQEGWAQS
jgi:hypothetical protein